VSGLRVGAGLATGQRAPRVRGLRPAELGDGGDDLSSHADAVDGVVRGRLARDEPEAGRIRPRSQARVGPGLLPDGVDDAAALAGGDGAPRARAALRFGRGRRDVGGRRGGGRKGPAEAGEVDRRDRREVKEPKGLGRVRLARVPDVSAASLIAFVEASVEPGATVMSDGWSAYRALPVHGYFHSKTVLSASGDPAQVAMPRRAPRRQPAQAVAARHPPGLGLSRAPRRLPGRVHVPLQPAQLAPARAALLAAARAGPRHRADHLPPVRRQPAAQTPPAHSSDRPASEPRQPRSTTGRAALARPEAARSRDQPLT
jgi:hypothetical protein